MQGVCSYTTLENARKGLMREKGILWRTAKSAVTNTTGPL
jgi:hypothetical protein